jgi:aquaporin Z
VLSIFFFVSSYRLMRWTPLMVWILVGVVVWLEAPVSGTSLNPARSYSPGFLALA